MTKEIDWTSADNIFKTFDLNKDSIIDEKKFFLLCKELYDEKEVNENEWRVKEMFKIFSLNDQKGLEISKWIRCFTKWIKKKPVNVLIVVDVQNDFIDGNLALPNRTGYEVIKPINRLLKQARWDQVIYSFDWHPENHISFYDNLAKRKLHPSSKITKEKAKPFNTVTFLKPHIEQILWPKHCVMNSWGAKLNNDLYILPNSIQIYKGQDPDSDAYSIFTKENQEIILSKIKATDLYICGLASDVCVKETCLEGLKLGYNVIMIEDSCRGIDKNKTEEAKKLIMENGGLVTNSNHVLSLVNEGKRSLILDHHASNKPSVKTCISIDDKNALVN
ncbi:nicotinamidase-like [Vespa mandarinia]|uniref:nicotinamidase-like n=1 Tax=Vespa mandarinia TaxID=7446 RepID=UPI001608EE59|nr:nicotinamidase-like [Vespa mandarinia]